jgi:protoporphyrinogen oxidase
VLGAGPAGLAAAHELATRGVDVCVLERAPWVGGLSLTWEHEGFRFDLGGHRWFTKKDWLDRWFRELMEGELVEVHRISRICFEGRYFDYPVAVMNVLRNAGLATSVHAVLSYAVEQVRQRFRREPMENIEQAYIAQFGPKLYEMFFRRYTEKVWGRDCSRLSADWVTQRTRGLSIYETLKNALVPQEVRRTGAKVESLVDSFLYPRLGYQRISERMKQDIEAAGGRVLLNADVKSLSIRAGEVVVRYRDREADVEREAVGCHAVSTIPLGKLVEIVEPGAPDDVLEAAKGLEFRSVITANIMLRKPQVTTDTWLYVHDEGVGFARIHEPRNWSEAMCPPGKTSICAEWFCTRGDAIWALADDEIVERTIGHLADDLGFIERDEVIGGFALRALHAYPVYSLDYAERVGSLKAHLSQYEAEISIAGRGGTFRYNNADHSIETGLLVAQNLLGEAHDVDQVNAEPDYHEEKAVDRDGA